MALPEPKKQPNGTWLIQVQVDGKRKAKTFDNKKDAIAWAAAVKAGKQKIARDPMDMTVGDMVDRYIDLKSGVLSPSTICNYKSDRKNRFHTIEEIKLRDLDHEKVQRWVNGLSQTLSPKSVRNAHGLLSVSLAEYYPEFHLHTALPDNVKPDIRIPSDEEINAILAASKGTRHELPIWLAVWLGLRASEIRGLKWDCIDGDKIHIRAAVVRGEDGLVEKKTKTYSGKRTLDLPQYLKELIDAQPHNGEYIVRQGAHDIYNGFNKICKEAGVPHYRFHDLRHYNASVMLALGVPDKYAMERMGHATNNMLKTVYQHTMAEKQKETTAKLESFFSQKCK